MSINVLLPERAAADGRVGHDHLLAKRLRDVDELVRQVVDEGEGVAVEEDLGRRGGGEGVEGGREGRHINSQ